VCRTLRQPGCRGPRKNTSARLGRNPEEMANLRARQTLKKLVAGLDALRTTQGSCAGVSRLRWNKLTLVTIPEKRTSRPK